MKQENPFINIKSDSRDPDPWLALYLDNSIPLAEETKIAILKDSKSWSRKYLLGLIKVWSRVTMLFIHILKTFIPKTFTSSRILHKILAWGLKKFVSPEANLLIFRHFHVGTEIVEFIAQNVDGISVQTTPLRPLNFEDVKQNLFLNHDLNLFNFIININNALREKGLELKPKSKLNFDMITQGHFPLIDFPKKRSNILDLQSAIEIFTPFYQFFLTDNDFWRASNSLQLDETIGIYAVKILGTPGHLALVNNKHPMVHLTTFGAAFRLVLHGLASETLHEILVQQKLQNQMEEKLFTANKF